VVWVGKDRTKQSFEAFFDALGPARAARVEAISLDGSSIYMPVARDRIPQATVCLDPFHVLKWTNEVLDSVYRAEAPRIPLAPGLPTRREWRRTRYALRAGWERLDPQHRNIVNALRRHRYKLWRTWELKERLRELYRSVHPDDAAAYLKAWCTSALRSRIKAFTMVRRIRKHFDAIIAAIRLGLSNSRLEGINARIRLQRRGSGIRDLDSLTSMIYLCLGGITITLPPKRPRDPDGNEGHHERYLPTRRPRTRSMRASTALGSSMPSRTRRRSRFSMMSANGASRYLRHRLVIHIDFLANSLASACSTTSSTIVTPVAVARTWCSRCRSARLGTRLLRRMFLRELLSFSP
jgi:hypothetical protein